MLFSIIVPVHNAGQHIERCVKSLLHQNVNTQIILVENGSTDNSLNICKSLSEKNDNVELYVCTKTGASPARNMGLSYVKGDIISFCDADDYFTEDSLIAICDAFEEHNVDIVFTVIQIIKDDNVSVFLPKKEEIIGVSKAIDYVVCNPCTWGSVCNKFYKKELIGLMHFPEDITHLEDGYMNLSLLSNHRNVKIFISKQITYNYVMNPSSMSNQIQKVFSADGRYNYNIALNRMLVDLLLKQQEKESIRDGIFSTSVNRYYRSSQQLSTLQKEELYNEIKKNILVFLIRVFRYDKINRFKIFIKGICILITGIR